jgi:hypothetical protein
MAVWILILERQIRQINFILMKLIYSILSFLVVLTVIFSSSSIRQSTVAITCTVKP